MGADALKFAHEKSSEVVPHPMLTAHLPTHPPLENFALSHSDLMKLKVPQQEVFVDPFLVRGGLIMVYAKRGVGKTWFAMELARALAKGIPFFAWQVPETRRVLYIDGEMSLPDLKSRLRFLIGKSPCEELTVIPSELLGKDHLSLNINLVATQKYIDEFLAKYPQDVVIFDNLSSLCYGRDENSNSELDELLMWFRSLRHRGIAVIIIHHAGKSNEQRGASRLEDILDTSIKLTEQPGLSEGTSFKIEFTKTRGLKPKPYELTVTLNDTGEGLEWEFSNKKPLPVKIAILMHIHAGKTNTQAKLVGVMGKDKGYVSKMVSKLKVEGLLANTKELSLTPKGEKEVQLYPSALIEEYVP